MLAVVLLRHPIVRVALEGAVSLATGYEVRFGDQRLGWSHAAFLNVHVRKNGDPVLDAARVDVEYALRDIFPGGQHRFGFAAVAIQAPVLTITRHADGTMTFSPPGGLSNAQPPSATQNAATPFYFTARIRQGEIHLVDQAPLLPDLREQTIAGVTLDASVKSDARSTARLAGVLLARRSSGAALQRYPFSVRALIDATRGLSVTRLSAGELPLRGPLSFLVHTKAVRFDDGLLDGIDASAYALGKPGSPFQYTVGAAFTLRGGRIIVPALAKPLRDLGGAFVLSDGTLATGALSGTVGGVALRGKGALFDLFGVPRFRLAVAGDGDLTALRTLFAFSAHLPLTGGAHLETLLAAQLAKPLIRTWFAAAHVAYGRFPIDDVNGQADYYNSALLLGGIVAQYGPAAVLTGGRIDFSYAGTDIVLVASAHGAGAQLPYTNVFAPDAAIDATALLTEPPHAKFSARGTLSATGGTNGGLTFSVDQFGVGNFGPFQFARRDGSSLAGAFTLDRPISGSAGWLHMRGFRLAKIARQINLPGARIPTLPLIAGVVDGDLAGGGTPSQFGIAGTLSGRDLAVESYPVGTGAVTLGGTLADLRLGGIRADGPLGRFRGRGAYGNGVFGLEGRYDGTLAQLQPFTHDAADRGEVHGPVSATIAGSSVVIQTTGADLPGGSVRGVAVEHIAGTLVVGGKGLRVVAADGTIGGGEAVARDIGGAFVVSAPGLDAGALRGAGVPLQDGRLAVLGTADLRGAPRFDGLVALDRGVADGYPVSGSADLALDGATVTVRSGTGALDTTYGRFSGRLNDLGHVTAYDLRAEVPVGDVSDVRRTLRLPLKTLEGSFGAQLHVGGRGAQPEVRGTLSVPEGSYNGLDFSDAHAGVALDAQRIAARDGSVTFGSTQAMVAGEYALASRRFALDVNAPRADLADFDDYFNEAESLAGRGSAAFALSDTDGVRSSGRIVLTGFRYRRFSFGAADASWSPRAGALAGSAGVHGPAGALRAVGSITPGAGPLPAALHAALYHLTVDAHDVDLATWLPAAQVNVPVSGIVAAHGTIDGRSPRLVVAANATLEHGIVYGYSVHEGLLRATSDGERIAFTDSVLDLGFARLNVGGSVGFATNVPLALTLQVQTPDIGTALATAFPKGPHYNVGGAAEATALISGTLAKPYATAGFSLTGAHYGALNVARILGSASYDGATLLVNDAEATFAHGSILVAGSLPLRLEPFGIASDRPFSFTLGFNSLDVAPFAPFVPGPQTKLGGTLDGRLAIEGTMRAPRVVGTATLSGGTYVSGLDTAGVTAANARLAFSGTSVALEALNAKVGTGTVSGSGSIDLPFPGTHTSGYAIALGIHAATINSPQYGRGTFDGALRLTRGATLPALSGTIALDNASIPFSAITRGASFGATPGAKPPFDIDFDDLQITVGKNVRVQSAIIDVGATGTLDLTGSLSAPLLDGELTATRGGIFSTYNRVFRIQEAHVSFSPSRGLVPLVQMRAYAHVANPDPDPTRNAVGSADITILVDGTSDEIARGNAITFSSSPPYSQEQIVGLLIDASIFGAVNFGQSQNGTSLRGAPGESNVLLPPGTTPGQTGNISFNQEAFSIANGQFTQRFLAPLERFLGGALNLTDIELTVDYGGGIGYNALKQIGTRDIYLSFGQTLSYPVRTTVGLTARPNATTSIDFNYFTQNGYPAITTDSNGQAFGYVERLHGIEPLTGRTGFTFLVVRKYP